MFIVFEDYCQAVVESLRVKMGCPLSHAESLVQAAESVVVEGWDEEHTPGWAVRRILKMRQSRQLRLSTK